MQCRPHACRREVVKFGHSWFPFRILQTAGQGDDYDKCDTNLGIVRKLHITRIVYNLHITILSCQQHKFTVNDLDHLVI